MIDIVGVFPQILAINNNIAKNILIHIFEWDLNFLFAYI
jgi:hypothetical protein